MCNLYTKASQFSSLRHSLKTRRVSSIDEISSAPAKKMISGPPGFFSIKRAKAACRFIPSCSRADVNPVACCLFNMIEYRPVCDTLEQRQQTRVSFLVRTRRFYSSRWRRRRPMKGDFEIMPRAARTLSLDAFLSVRLHAARACICTHKKCLSHTTRVFTSFSFKGGWGSELDGCTSSRRPLTWTLLVDYLSHLEIPIYFTFIRVTFDGSCKLSSCYNESDFINIK